MKVMKNAPGDLLQLCGGTFASCEDGAFQYLTKRCTEASFSAAA